MTAKEGWRPREGEETGRRNSLGKMTQGRTTGVRNFKFCYGYREERHTQRKEVGKGLGNNFAFTSRAIGSFKQGVTADQVAISCEGHSPLPCRAEYSRRQELHSHHLANLLPRPGLRETFRGSHFITVHS